MNCFQFSLLTLSLTLGVFHYVLTDGQRDHGEACSLRSQIANLFRQNDNPEGCMSSKGLVCLSHKCVCADPSNVYEVPEPTSNSGSTTQEIQQGISAASNFFKKLVGRTTTTTTTSTTAAPSTSTGTGGGKCVGRAGSPCFTNNSTCVKHAVCEGTPRLCKCQGIYSSNAQGMCSKTASVVNQVIKQTVG